jgi:sigma-B regulation protein RsbU (phosphoserine phosphatase)
LAVLDAMGHGLEASRIANLAVAAYRNARRRSLDLREMFREIDQAVADEIGDHRFVTGQLAELDTTTGVLRMVNAGHPLPLLFRQGRDIGDVPCRPCLPLGLGGMEAHEAHYELEPGDVVVFHTDGVTEARSGTGEEFGRERLGALVSRSLQARERPAEVLRQVVSAAHDHGGARLRDDATLVLLSWLGNEVARSSP